MKFLLVGGGSLGPVTPLIAFASALKRLHPEATFAWAGTPDGPERSVVEHAGFSFSPIPVAKLPRYPSVRLLSFPFDWWRAKRAARACLGTERPDAVITAGGFTAVPVVSAAAAKGIPCFTHQLDLVPGLANKRIAKRCRFVTTTFEYEKPPFGTWVSDEPIPTPMRFADAALPSRDEAVRAFGLDPTRPVIVVVGGGTGAHRLNTHLWRTLDAWLAFTQVIHVTGIGKGSEGVSRSGYVQKPLLEAEAMLQAYAAADLMVGRAGIGFLTECAGLKKACILVPIPSNQQEYNARAVEERGAAVVLDQNVSSFDGDLPETARLLLGDAEERGQMGERLHKALPTDDGSVWATKVLRELGVRMPAQEGAKKPFTLQEKEHEAPAVETDAEPVKPSASATRPKKRPAAKKSVRRSRIAS